MKNRDSTPVLSGAKSKHNIQTNITLCSYYYSGNATCKYIIFPIREELKKKKEKKMFLKYHWYMRNEYRGDSYLHLIMRELAAIVV